MARMVKLLFMGVLATAVVGAITSLTLNATDASGAVGGVALMLAAFITALIALVVAQHLPPPKNHR